MIIFQTNQRVHILCGHSRPVSCLSVLDTQQQLSEVILLTGASDKLICVSFVQLSEVILLTGASDKLICVSFVIKNEFYRPRT